LAQDPKILAIDFLFQNSKLRNSNKPFSVFKTFSNSTFSFFQRSHFQTAITQQGDNLTKLFFFIIADAAAK